jgi:multiple sugar transport system substrate-binding protein
MQAVSQPAKVWSEALDYAWCAPRLPQGFQIDQEIGFLINKVVVGELQPKAALDEAAIKVKAIMAKNGFYKGADPMNYAATEPGFWMGKDKKSPF